MNTSVELPPVGLCSWSSERTMDWKMGPHTYSLLAGYAGILFPRPALFAVRGVGMPTVEGRSMGSLMCQLSCYNVTGVTAFILLEFQPTRVWFRG